MNVATHGVWVQMLRVPFTRVGRVAFYDEDTHLVWVMWEPMPLQSDAGQAMKRRGAGPYPPQDLRVLPVRPKPWWQSD